MSSGAEDCEAGTSTQVGFMAWLSLILGVVLLSFAAIFTRLAEAELSAAATLFNRYFLAALALAVWIPLSGSTSNREASNSDGASRQIGLIVLSSILGTLAVGLWAISLTQTSVANSNLLHNVTPVFVLIGGWLVLGQRFEAGYLLGILLAIAGVGLLSIADLQRQDSGSLGGDGLALASAVFYAANYLTREQLRQRLPATHILFWTCLLSSLYSAALVWAAHQQPFPQTWQTWMAVLGLALVCQILGQGLLIHQLNRVSASFVTLLMLLEPLITALLAAVIFRERLSALNWLAFAIVLAGIALARISAASNGGGPARLPPDSTLPS